tara:strand:- start:685 stop:1200 length:516 start_codon:yes stop_codon:yes gene_type:complete
MIIFIIGKSGSGKTTISNELKKHLMQQYDKIFIQIDGDDVRKIYDDKLGYSINDRRKNADRIKNLCKFFDKQNINVIVSVLSIFQDLLNWNRNNYNEYLEVYLKVNQSILENKRDFKGIYKKKKNVIGKDIPFPEPLIPDIIINNNKDLSNFNPLINDIIAKIKMKYKNFI